MYQMMTKRRICVFGSYRDLGKREKEDIVKLGTLLAGEGFDVITGGFGGTMEDVSMGAKKAGGKTIGVTYYKKQGPSKKPNRYVDEEIRTKNIFDRIDVMMKNSDGFIVLPGGTGTLLELAACLEHINKGMLKPKPIIALGDFWKPVAEKLTGEPVLNDEARSEFGALSCSDLITFVGTVEEAVGRIVSALQ
ncbi:MAG: hypothetical protein A2Z72_00405 [Omnitrophica bacterium RBG_13_46_9]|nr:MAG: hypothetical protein A2Z72_00405 [Omnitrophica bacterium RBG_13_46_9]